MSSQSDEQQATAAETPDVDRTVVTHVGPTVVGIGASAGGLSALKAFFAQVPSDSQLAFVIVVHLSPDHESHLSELLATDASLPVEQVTQDTELRAGQIY